MVPVQASSRVSAIVIGAALAILGISGCSAADSSRQESGNASQVAGDSVAGAWARVQATEYGGCPKGSCKDYLSNLVKQLESLESVMAATDDEKFEKPISIMNDIPDSSSSDIDSKREYIFDVRAQLKSWFSRNPEEARGAAN